MWRCVEPNESLVEGISKEAAGETKFASKVFPDPGARARQCHLLVTLGWSDKEPLAGVQVGMLGSQTRISCEWLTQRNVKASAISVEKGLDVQAVTV